MQDRVMVGKYYPNKSIIHLLNSLTKIISLFLLLLMVIINNNLVGFITIVSITLILSLLAKIPVIIYVNTIKRTGILFILLMLIHLVITHNFILSSMFVIELICLLFNLILLVMTTSLTEITYGLELFFTPLKKINIKVNDLSLKITNFLRFIPMYIDNKERLVKKFKNHNIIINNKDLSLKFQITKKAYRLAKKQLKQTAKMMNIRLYSIKEYRTNFRLNKFSFIDSMIIFVLIISLIFSIVSEVI